MRCVGPGLGPGWGRVEGWAGAGLAPAHPQTTLNPNLAPFVFLGALVSLGTGPGLRLGWARVGLGQARVGLGRAKEK